MLRLLVRPAPLESNPAPTAGPDRCPACASAAPPREVFRARGFPILRCLGCGLGHTQVPGDFDPSAIYDQSYFQGGQNDGYADYQGSRKHLAMEFRNVLADMVRAGASSGRLLEIGCAYGFFLEEARASFRVSGVELAEEAVAACRARGLDVVRRADEAFYWQRGPFDVVVMLDVIEHLAAPRDFLRDLQRHTRSGGRLVITTGDFGSLAARLTGRHWRLMTPPEHLWYFTVQALSGLLEASGFRLVRVTHPTKRVPLGLIAFQLARYARLQSWIRGRRIPGSLPVNLFDAMRVIAERV